MIRYAFKMTGDRTNNKTVIKFGLITSGCKTTNSIHI